MLDIMRKHASSWFTRILFGIIIVVFIFFFGYSSMRKGMRGGRLGASGQKIAVVNGVPISSSEFNFFYDRNFERIKSSFEGKEVPEFAKKIAQSNTMEQLIYRETALAQADILGIDVSDTELADTIEEIQSKGEGGEFDPIAYRHQFLPYFKGRFGLDYEEFVRQDLRMEALTRIFEGVDRQTDLSTSRDAKWTFEIVAIDPSTLPNAKEAADKIIKSGNWKQTLKSLKLEAKKVGPITLAGRRQIMDGNATVEDHGKIFALKKKQTVLGELIERAGKIYVVKLVDFAESDNKEVNASPRSNFFLEWMAKARAEAKVKTFLDQEK